MKVFLRNFMVVVLSLTASTVISVWLNSIGWQETTTVLIYLLSVFFVATKTNGYFYGILASLLSVIVFNYLFTEPFYTLYVDNPEYVFTFMMMLIVSVVTSSIFQKLSSQHQLAINNEKDLRLLVGISNLLVENMRLKDALYQIHDRITYELKSDVFILVKELSQQNSTLLIGCEQLNKLFLQGVESSLSTSELVKIESNPQKNKSHYFFPIKSKEKGEAVLVVCNQRLSKEHVDLFRAIATLIGIALDRQLFVVKQQESLMQIEQEKLRVQLLSAISHDLRTPLSSMIGSTHTIKEHLSTLDIEVIRQLLSTIESDATWLLESVENILSLMKLQETTLSLTLQEHVVDEIIEEALSTFADKDAIRISTKLPSEVVLLPCDRSLMIKVLINLLSNALKFSDVDQPVQLHVRKKNQFVIFEVIDRGIGLSDAQKIRVFDRFYSVKSSSSRAGLGLGLSICKSIVDAHHGSIRVLDNQQHGCKFVVTLPLEVKHDSKNLDY